MEKHGMRNLSETLQGIIVPLVTPFTAEGRVDEKSLRALVNHVLDGGVNGLFVMGTTGEFQYLSFEEQRSAIEIAVVEVGGRAIVLAGVTGKSVEETVRNATVIERLSTPPHALVVAPLFYHSNHKLLEHMKRLSDISNLPIILYNNLGIVTRNWRQKNIIPDLVEEMASIPNIVGIKDSSGNPDYFARLLKCRSDGFHIFQGDESSILPSLKKGAVGAVPSLGNILPWLCTGLYDAFIQDEKKAAKNYQTTIHRIDALYPNTVSIPAILKLFLARKGVIADPMSYIAFKDNKDRIMSLIESATGEVGQKECV